MSDLVDNSRIDIKIGKYGTTNANSISDPTLLPRVQGYRRAVGSRMIPFDKETMKKKLPASEYYLSRKIDGEFTVLVYKNGEIFTINPGGTVRCGLPLLEEAEKILKKAKVKEGIFAGELWVDREDDKRPRVHDVVRVARRPEKVGDLKLLKFAIFDILELNGEQPKPDYSTIWPEIEKIFKGGDLVHPVETVKVKDEKAVFEHFDRWVEKEGAEGIVLRSDSTGAFKIKPRHTLDLAIVGFAEGTDDRLGMLHDMLLAIVRPDGSFHIAGRVGGGFTDDQRREFLSDLSDLVVESEYAEVNSDRVAYQMVKPELVAEISCLDVISETTRGGTIDRMVLTYDTKEDKWETVRRLPLVSIISPQFMRIRDDKKSRAEDVGIDQFTRIVEVAQADKTAKDLELPKSKILKRIVATKSLKGATMVRKLMMWKTNKEDKSDEYPAYVLYLTDFSPNRKDPMKRDIRVSDSKEQIDELWKAMEKKNLDVRGWEIVEPEK